MKKIKRVVDLSFLKLQLTDEGDLIIKQLEVPQDEVQHTLETTGTEPHENTHTILGAMRMFDQYYNIINKDLTAYVESV